MANGYILYEGPSKIDGNNIVVIATGFNASSSNRKTGGMIQTYILVQDSEPHVAIKNGDDFSICGNCVHRGSKERGRSCYVNIGQGPLSVYRAWKRGSYPALTDYSIFTDLLVRFGTYGDPAAVPHNIWNDIDQVCQDNTGYTHQWKNCSPMYARWCMASVESKAEALEAHNKGYRTFRVGLEKDIRVKGEVLCPASEEAGKKLQCFQCLACNGSGRRGHIFIPAHGNSAVMSNIKKIPMKIAA